MSKDIFDFSDLNELVGSTKGVEACRKYEEAHGDRAPERLKEYADKIKVRKSTADDTNSLRIGVEYVDKKH